MRSQTTTKVLTLISANLITKDQVALDKQLSRVNQKLAEKPNVMLGQAVQVGQLMLLGQSQTAALNLFERVILMQMK